MKAEIIKDGVKVGEISFSEGTINISCEDNNLKDRIFLHLTSPEVTEESQTKKLVAMQGTEPGTIQFFRAALEFIDEMEKDFEFTYNK